jgi:hypothetical protein
MNDPVRMLTGTAEREDKTTSTTFKELIPTPGEVFTTTKTATLTALFVTECRVSASTQSLQIRITVDGVVAPPKEVVLTQNTKYETHSHLAFKTSVPAGSHKVTVEWKVSGGTGYVRNRSFTVWEVQ